jgi:hypothetical protein
VIACFGGQTVTFVTVTEVGEPGYLGLKAKARAEVAVTGCHFRPAGSSEQVGQTDVATGLWRCTAPPVGAVLDAMPGDEVKCGGLTYQVEGVVQPKYDLDGSVHHVTVMCKRQVG